MARIGRRWGIRRVPNLGYMTKWDKIYLDAIGHNDPEDPTRVRIKLTDLEEMMVGIQEFERVKNNKGDEFESLRLTARKVRCQWIMCSRYFYTARGNQVYCSKKCSKAFWRKGVLARRKAVKLLKLDWKEGLISYEDVKKAEREAVNKLKTRQSP